ncbi:MAG: NDMA-dependent alcohol dehydrogenase [Actinomycetota bacterium]|nr:NDMA-dependent alcohol dehydrogenase [Actinomycetota bacterium]
MKVRAALLFSQPGKWQVVDVDLDDPSDTEVLVRIVASGMCHSDDHIAKGDTSPLHMPYCAGHEVAGVVEAVGSAVRSLEVGDHIVTSFIPGCGRCRFCTAGMQNLCQNGAMIGTGAQMDGSFRMHFEGTDVARASMIGGFAEMAVMPEISCVKIPKHVPLRAAALLGCGVPTGWGSAVRAALVEPGDVVIVIGTGGVGINAVQGSAHAGALRTIAVDPVAFKREASIQMGATDAVASIAEAAELAGSLTDGQGADSAIITVGVLTAEDVGSAFNAVRKGGTVVVTAVAPPSVQSLPINPLVLAMYQKRIQGCLYGMMSPSSDVLMLLRLYEEGRLKLDELVTRTYSLEEINLGYEDMHAGRNLRGLIEFS